MLLLFAQLKMAGLADQRPLILTLKIRTMSSVEKPLNIIFWYE
jgi:hypothetical protein